MKKDFAAFSEFPLTGAVGQPAPGMRSYDLPLGLEALGDEPRALNDLHVTIEHLDSHLAFLKVQLWANSLLNFWDENLPSVKRVGIVTDPDEWNYLDQKDWMFWARGDDFHVGAKKNGDWDTVSHLNARQRGYSEEDLKPISQASFRALRLPGGPHVGLLLQKFLTKDMSEATQKAGWTREEWKNRLASIYHLPGVFEELRAQRLEQTLPAAEPSLTRSGPRF